MSGHFLLGLLLIGQTIVSAVAISFLAHIHATTSRQLGKEVQYVAQIAERVLNKVEHNA